jgi:hypothetical protein
MMNGWCVVDRIELPPARRRDSKLERVGLSPTQRRRFIDGVIYALVVVFAAAWTATVVYAVHTGTPRPGLVAGLSGNPLSADAPPPAPFLLDAALRSLTERAGFTGYSGEVRVVVHEPGAPPPLAVAP